MRRSTPFSAFNLISVAVLILCSSFALCTTPAHSNEPNEQQDDTQNFIEIKTEQLDERNQPAKTVGYTIGDVIIQRIVSVSSDAIIDLSEPPALDRVGPWLERQSVNAKKHFRNQSWVEIRYQIINSPVSARAASLPALTLSSRNGTSIEVKPWPFSLGPMTPEVTSDADILSLIRSNRTAPSFSSQHHRKTVRMAITVLIAILLCWLLWWVWRERKDAKRLPFAHAYRQLKKMGAAGADENTQAWIYMHEAMNQCAGQVLTLGNVSELYRRHPWLASQNDDIQQFYTASSRRFFDSSANQNGFALFKLCKKLYKAEKMQAY